MSEDPIINVAIPVRALGRDDLTVVGPANLEVTASAGELDGIVLAVDGSAEYTSVSLGLHSAEQLVDALALAIQADGSATMSHMAAAVSDHDGSRAAVEVATDHTAAGIFLGLLESELMRHTSVLLGVEEAQALGEALQQAGEYLVANGYTA